MNEISNNIKSSLWTTKGFWIAAVTCTAIIAGTFSGIVSYIAFFLSVLAIVLLSQEDGLCFMMIVMPFANIFKSSPESQSFFTYLVLIYVLWYIVKTRYVHKTFLLAIGVLVIYLLVQMTVSSNMLRTIKFVANLLFIYLSVKSEASRNIDNIKKLCLFYITGIVVSSTMAALNIIPNLIDYIGTEDVWLQTGQMERFTGMYSDPNYYSVNVIISLCLIVILNHKKLLSAIPSVCLAAALVIFVGLTLSKSAFLMLMLPLFLLILSKIKRKNYFVLFCVLVVCIVLAVQILSGKIEMFSGVIYRLDEATDIDSLFTGRSYIWQNYLEFLYENPLKLMFGGGFGAEILDDLAAHNTYIDSLYYLGIIGTLLLALVFGVLLNINKSTEKLNFFNYSVWICIGVMYFFLSELFYFDWAFHVVIGIWILKMDMSPVRSVKR